MAFVFAAIVFVVTCIIGFFEFTGAMMSDNPEMSNAMATTFFWTLGIGFGLAALIAASHWMHLHW